MAPDQPALRMTVRRSGGSVVLALAGEADVAGEQRLRVRLRTLLSDPAVRHVVVDLGDLHFLDLAALGALTDAAGELARHGGSLVLRSPRRRVRRLLDVLAAHERLPLVE